MNAESAREPRVIIKRLLGKAGLPLGGRVVVLGLCHMVLALGLYGFLRRTKAATELAEMRNAVLASAE